MASEGLAAQKEARRASCQHRGPALLASRAGRQYISVAEATQVQGSVSLRPQDTIRAMQGRSVAREECEATKVVFCCFVLLF